MEYEFQGNAVIAGAASGEAVVSRKPFNNLASFYGTVRTDAETVICSDQNNPDLFGKELTGKIVCVARSIGSTSAGAMWEEIAHRGLAPKAMLFAESIDSLAAAGLILADIWAGNTVVAVDSLGEGFLDAVADGDRVSIHPDGRVTVTKHA